MGRIGAITEGVVPTMVSPLTWQSAFLGSISTATGTPTVGNLCSKIINTAKAIMAIRLTELGKAGSLENV
jgi:hypothetical protein